MVCQRLFNQPPFRLPMCIGPTGQGEIVPCRTSRLWCRVSRPGGWTAKVLCSIKELRADAGYSYPAAMPSDTPDAAA